MAPKTFNAEGGVDGVTLTTSDTGSGDAPTTVTTSGDAILKYSNVSKYGAMGFRLATRTTSLANWVSWTAAAPMTVGYGRFYLRCDDMITSTAKQVLQLQTVSGGSIGMYLQITGAGDWPRIRHGNDTDAWVSTNSLAEEIWYRWEWGYQAPPGTAAGLARIKVYPGDSNTLHSDSDWVAVTATGSFSTFNYVSMGVVNATADSPSSTGFFYYDNLVMFANDWPGPASALIEGRGDFSQLAPSQRARR